MSMYVYTEQLRGLRALTLYAIKSPVVILQLALRMHLWFHIWGFNQLMIK